LAAAGSSASTAQLQQLPNRLKALSQVDADWKNAKADLKKTCDVLKSAKAAKYSAIERQASKLVNAALEDAKEQGKEETLHVLMQHGPEDIIGTARGILSKHSDMEHMLDGKQWPDLCAFAAECQSIGCNGLAKQARERLRRHVNELKRLDASTEDAHPLLELYKAASSAGLTDIAELLFDRVGSAFPPTWAMASSKSLAVKKDVIGDSILIARMQQLVNETFFGWGGKGKLTGTRDRRNPLATDLKVEEVVHVANAENYLGYCKRREEIRADFMRLDPAEQNKDFDVKTRRVSLKGVSMHSEEPVDNSINEFWFWHGTGKEGAAGITDTDFDMKRAGSAAGTMFGAGLYFAESCMKADEYTRPDDRGLNPLILSRVTCGRMYYCDAKYPSDKKAELEGSCMGGGYHCVLGDREKVRGTFREFIVFDSDQVYPEYIVWYSRVEPYVKPL